MTKLNDKYFVDRDGKTFQDMINYLRNKAQVVPKFNTQHEEKMFMAELSFWGLKHLAKEICVDISASQQ